MSTKIKGVGLAWKGSGRTAAFGPGHPEDEDVCGPHPTAMAPWLVSPGNKSFCPFADPEPSLQWRHWPVSHRHTVLTLWVYSEKSVQRASPPVSSPTPAFLTTGPKHQPEPRGRHEKVTGQCLIWIGLDESGSCCWALVSQASLPPRLLRALAFAAALSGRGERLADVHRTLVTSTRVSDVSSAVDSLRGRPSERQSQPHALAP